MTAYLIVALAAYQVFLGINTVLSGLATDTRAQHAAIGYALWAAIFYFSIRSGGFRFLWDKK